MRAQGPEPPSPVRPTSKIPRCNSPIDFKKCECLEINQAFIRVGGGVPPGAPGAPRNILDRRSHSLKIYFCSGDATLLLELHF